MDICWDLERNQPGVLPLVKPIWNLNLEFRFQDRRLGTECAEFNQLQAARESGGGVSSKRCRTAPLHVFSRQKGNAKSYDIEIS